MSQSGCHGGVWSHHVHPTCTPSSHARTPHLSTWEGPRTQMYVQDLWPPNPPKSINSNHRTIMLVLLQATLPWTSLVITASKPRRKAYGKTTCSMSIDARSNKQLCKVNSLGGGRPCDRRSILVGRELVMGVASRIKSDHWWPLVFASSPCFVGVWVVCKNIVYGSYTRMASIQKKCLWPGLHHHDTFLNNQVPLAKTTHLTPNVSVWRLPYIKRGENHDKHKHTYYTN